MRPKVLTSTSPLPGSTPPAAREYSKTSQITAARPAPPSCSSPTAWTTPHVSRTGSSSFTADTSPWTALPEDVFKRARELTEMGLDDAQPAAIAENSANAERPAESVYTAEQLRRAVLALLGKEAAD